MSVVSVCLNPLRVLIVGCGNIAGGFDQRRSASDLPYTHAGAYARDGRFKITVCVDPDDIRRAEFMEVWSVPVGVRSINELLDTGEKFDVISICSPTLCHAHDLEIALRLNPKLIFCEKPITPSLADAEGLVAECDKANILLAVNYTRRWDPYVAQLHASMQAGQWGVLRSVVGLYSKGILNNGSHMFDLLHVLVGPLEIVKIGKPIYDFFPNDPTVSVWLQGPQEVPIHIACSHAEDFTVFELELIFSHGVLTMEDGGLFWRERRVIDNVTYKGYRKLDEGVRQAGGYPHAMLQAVDNIYRAIKQREPLASTGDTALSAQRLCEQIIQQASEL